MFLSLPKIGNSFFKMNDKNHLTSKVSNQVRLRYFFSEKLILTRFLSLDFELKSVVRDHPA